MSTFNEPSAPAVSATPPVGLWQALNTPLWPDSRVNLTTPLHLVLMVTSLLLGLLCYATGYTFDGGTLVYLAVLVILTRPYYVRAYRGWAYLLMLLPLIPTGNFIQNHLLGNGQMVHPTDGNYLLGRITAEGDGPFKWTRFLYTGAEQPSIDGSVDHLLLSYWFTTSFMMFMYVLPERFKRPHRASQLGFYAFFISFSALFLALPVLFPNRAGISPDWLWVLTSMSLGYAWITLLLSKSFRTLARTPAMLLWLVVMGLVLSPGFETLHSCINHDYWYVAERNMATLFVCNGETITVNAPFYHIGYSILYPGMLGVLMDYLPKIAVRNPNATYTALLSQPETKS